MSDTLNNKEVKRLGELGQVIQGSLSCDINDNNIPCRTDRLNAIKHMKEYLEIHGYTIKSNQQPFCNNGMITDEEAKPLDLVNGRDCDGTPY